MKEVWADISGFEGFYQVSNKGNVRSLPRTIMTKRGSERRQPGKLIKPFKTSNGYLRVHLYAQGKSEKWRVHRLVAMAFLPHNPEFQVVNHIDGNQENNVVTNLEWCTQGRNVQHAFATGLNPGIGKLSSAEIELIKATYKRYSREHGTCALSQKYGVCSATIWNAVHDRRKLVKK